VHSHWWRFCGWLPRLPLHPRFDDDFDDDFEDGEGAEEEEDEEEEEGEGEGEEEDDEEVDLDNEGDDDLGDDDGDDDGREEVGGQGEGGGALAGDGVAPMKKVASPSGLDAFADPLDGDGDGDGELDEEAEAGRGASRPTSGLFPPRTGSSGGAGFGSDDGDEYHSFGEEAEASSQFQVDVEEVESWEKEQVWEGLRVLRWCTPRLAASRQ
jgi:hypothetical protein